MLSLTTAAFRGEPATGGVMVLMHASRRSRGKETREK